MDNPSRPQVVERPAAFPGSIACPVWQAYRSASGSDPRQTADDEWVPMGSERPAKASVNQPSLGIGRAHQLVPPHTPRTAGTTPCSACANRPGGGSASPVRRSQMTSATNRDYACCLSWTEPLPPFAKFDRCTRVPNLLCHKRLVRSGPPAEIGYVGLRNTFGARQPGASTGRSPASRYASGFDLVRRQDGKTALKTHRHSASEPP
jgi:hypothetical protein